MIEALLAVAGKPIPVREAHRIAERAVPGLTLKEFLTDIRNHHDTEDCVCIELRRRPDGAYASVRQIPKPHRAFGVRGEIEQGAVVVSA